MDKVRIKIIKGTSLSSELVKKIGAVWKKEFDDGITIDKKQDFADDLFFIVFNQKSQILSVGRLRPVHILFLSRKYDISGIADIVSIVRKKGYGKILMLTMYKYLKNRKLTGIGFCFRENSLFYKKCGFRILKNSVQRFLYKNPQGKTIIDLEDDDIFYLNGRDKFVKQIISHSQEKVLISRPHW